MAIDLAVADRADPRLAGRVDVAVLAKAPVPGFAKTRLIPELGKVGAARLQRWLLRRAVASAHAACLGEVTLWGAPHEDHLEFQRLCAGTALRLRSQPEVDLGGRMLAAINHPVSAVGTLIIGTDCPALTATLLRQAARALIEGADAVVIPAEDGGYVLIGLKRAEPKVFSQVAWSTDQVMQQTRDRFSALAWRSVELPAQWDVDLPEDFARLARQFPEVLSAVSPDPA